MYIVCMPAARQLWRYLLDFDGLMQHDNSTVRSGEEAKVGVRVRVRVSQLAI